MPPQTVRAPTLSELIDAILNAPDRTTAGDAGDELRRQFRAMAPGGRSYGDSLLAVKHTVWLWSESSLVPARRQELREWFGATEPSAEQSLALELWTRKVIKRLGFGTAPTIADVDQLLATELDTLDDLL